MKRLLLLALFLLTPWPLNLTAAQEDCPQPDESIAPDFAYETSDGTPNFANLIPQVTTYLNAGGDADALPDFFAAVEGNEDQLLESMSSQVYAVNVDDDAEDELVVAVAVIHLAVWGGGILLYDCDDAAYNLIGQVDLANNSYRDWGFELFEVADHTGDAQPEFYVHSDVGLRYIGYQALVWNGSDFVPLVWTTHFHDESLSLMVANGLAFPDVDADGQVEAQLSFGADSRERAFAYLDIYRIRDESFHFDCQIYLGDEPSFPISDSEFLIKTVEEADSYFRCGYDSVSEPLFRRVVEDESLEEFPINSEFFERENLRAFSLYRLVLLHARRGDMDAAADVYAQLNAEFPVEVPGSNYTSMAEAFWLEFEQSEDWDAACESLAAHIEPTVTMILDDDPLTRRSNGLYFSPYAGYPGHRPNLLIRGCPDHDIAAAFPDPAHPGMLPPP